MGPWGLSRWEAGDLLSGFGLGRRPTRCPGPAGASAAAQGVRLSTGGCGQGAWAAPRTCCATCQRSPPLPSPAVKGGTGVAQGGQTGFLFMSVGLPWRLPVGLEGKVLGLVGDAHRGSGQGGQHRCARICHLPRRWQLSAHSAPRRCDSVSASEAGPGGFREPEGVQGECLCSSSQSWLWSPAGHWASGLSVRSVPPLALLSRSVSTASGERGGTRDLAVLPRVRRR